MLQHLSIVKGLEMLVVTLQLWWHYLLQLHLLAATLQHLYLALFVIMVIIDDKTIMAMVVVITVIYMMSLIVILDAT